ncbi:MAG: UbiA family prenyltransferase, partial [Hyphomonas sp.]|nr:UbiA family prenyltransferase [Hyphomonas sp.]
LFYDTIYAHQDKEDDALIGVKSTALLFGKRAVLFSFFFYLGAAALIAAAAAMYGAGRLGAVTALAFLLHAATQVGRLKATGNAEALAVFKSNVWAGALVAGGLALAAMVPESKPKSIFADPEIVGEAEPDKVQLPFGLELHRKSQMPEGETWMLSDISRSLAKDGITIPDPDATETDPEE